MNKKIIKTIAGITCGLGIASSIPFATTSCGCSNKKVSLYNIPSLDSLLNFNPTQYINFCLDPNKDYTNGNPDIKVMDPDYIDYIKRITNDMFKEENFEKTKDFLAFFVASYSIYLLKAYTVGDSAELPVEEFSNVLKQTVKNFYLKISPISNFKYIGEKKGLDSFSFNCGYTMKIVAKNYQSDEYSEIECTVKINKRATWFRQFGGVFEQQEIEGVMYHFGLLLTELESESKDFYSRTSTVNNHTVSSSWEHLQSLGTYPSPTQYEYIKDLQISNHPNA